MLAYILAITVFSVSLALFSAAFLYQEVHKKHDFLLSGLGLFYGLVLWVCAGRITGGVLLGQLIVVTLLGYFVWETIKLRKAVANPDRLVEIANFSLAKWTEQKLALGAKSSRPKAPPLKTQASIVTETDKVEVDNAQPITSAVKDITEEAKNNLAQTQEAIDQKVGEVEDFVSEKSVLIENQASDIASDLKDKVDSTATKIQAQIEDEKSPLDGLTEVQESVTDKSKELAEVAKETATTAQEQVEVAAAKIEDSLPVNKVEGNKNTVKTSISTPSKPQKQSLFAGLLSKIKNLGTSKPQPIKETIKKKESEVKSSLGVTPVAPQTTSQDDFDFDEMDEKTDTPAFLPVEEVTAHTPPTNVTVIQEPDREEVTKVKDALKESEQNPDTPAFLPVEEVTAHTPPADVTVIQEPNIEELIEVNQSEQNQDTPVFSPVEEVTEHNDGEIVNQALEDTVSGSVEDSTDIPAEANSEGDKNKKTESITVQIIEYPATKGSKLMEIQIPKNDHESTPDED